MKNTIITISLLFFLSPAFAQMDTGKIKPFNFFAFNYERLLAMGTPSEEQGYYGKKAKMAGNGTSANAYGEIDVPKTQWGFAALAGYNIWADSGTYKQYFFLAGPVLSFRIFDKILMDLKVLGGISYSVMPSQGATGFVRTGFTDPSSGYIEDDETMENVYTKSLTASSFIFDLGVNFRFYIYKRICGMLAVDYMSSTFNFSGNTQVTQFYTVSSYTSLFVGGPSGSTTTYNNPPLVSNNAYASTLYAEYFTFSIGLGYCFGK